MNYIPRVKHNGVGRLIRDELTKRWQLYLLLLLPISFLVVFNYVPMYGAQISFRNYTAKDGILGSAWVGVKHFVKFFTSPQFWRLIRNTFVLSIYGLLAGFPIPVMLALALNNVDNEHYRKTVQMVTYAPHFISTVVLVGMMSQLFSYNYGLINKVIDTLGGSRKLFLTEPQYFRHLYVWSGVWQGMGYNSIIYISALSSIDPSLYEAAKVDGASRMQRILHIEIPGIILAGSYLWVMKRCCLCNVHKTMKPATYFLFTFTE